MFLKRAAFGHIESEDLFLGAILNVYSRQVKIVEYADVFTRNELEGKKSRTLALVKPDAYPHLGKIISEVYKMNFIIAQMRMVKMTKADAEEFFAAEKDQPYFADLVAHVTSDVVMALEVVGDSAIHAWQARIGATEETAGNPNTLRAVFGADKFVKNGIHGSKSIMDARNEIEFFFDRKWPTTAIFNNCTCAVIRPHAIKDTGDIIDRILSEGFEISAFQMQALSPVAAMEIRQENAVETFRKLVGPHDPEIARHLRPDTLRGQFGVDRVQNTLHCSDLPEDGLLECEYFFKMLQQ